MATLQPYLHLWEAQRFWNPITKENSRMTLAAIHALSLDSCPLDETWGVRFRRKYKEQAEAYADEQLAIFQKQLVW